MGTCAAPMAIMIASGVWPMSAAIETASSSDGTDSRMSTKRMMAVSTQPPKVAATRPRIMPPMRPTSVDTMPITRDARAPQMSLESMSPPKRSRPSGKPGISPGPGMWPGVMYS